MTTKCVTFGELNTGDFFKDPSSLFPDRLLLKTNVPWANTIHVGGLWSGVLVQAFDADALVIPVELEFQDG